jgi:hypothetical protein
VSAETPDELRKRLEEEGKVQKREPQHRRGDKKNANPVDPNPKGKGKK